MDYFREFQAFAGRFSAVAEERLHSVDGGTYREFISFYSKPWRGKAVNATDNEQWQIDILLEEFQLATEASALLSAPEGSVLHIGAAEAGIGEALSRLCTALERCLFFGAVRSAADFWRLLEFASGNDAIDSAEIYPVSSSVVKTGGDRDTKTGAGFNLEHVQPQRSRQLIRTVSGLTHVHSGHGRCRAWVRGLLSLDGESVEAELRHTAAVTARVMAISSERDKKMMPEQGLSESNDCATEADGSRHGADDPSVQHDAVSKSDTASGSGDSKAPGLAASLDDAGNKGAASSSSDQSRTILPHDLPLWLRTGSQGESILDDICMTLQDFQERLSDKALSVHSSLDHAWLDRENVAAAMTFTWPGFPRDHLRCYVNGAGVAVANGKYLPAESVVDRGSDLVLMGPNGCHVCRRASGSETEANCSNLPTADATVSTIDQRRGDALDARRVKSTIRRARALPLLQWFIAVPVPQGGEVRNVYYCQGDGPLPPCRGWRSIEAADEPAPVLVFGSSEEDLGMKVAGEDNHSGDKQNEKVNVPDFEAAVSVDRAERATTDTSTVCADGVDTLEEASDGIDRPVAVDTPIEGGIDSTAQMSCGALAQRKRPRFSQPVVIHLPDSEGDETRGLLQGDGVIAERSSRRRSVSAEDGIALLPKADDAGVSGPGGGVLMEGLLGDDDVDQEAAAFMSKGWRLPERDGELLIRAERTRQKLRLIQEERASLLSNRRREVLQLLESASEDYEKVIKEPAVVTVERALAARLALREIAEAEVAANMQVRASVELMIPSLEELVADKAEEICVKTLDSTASGNDEGAPRLGGNEGGGAGPRAGDPAINDEGPPDRGSREQDVKSLVDTSTLEWPWSKAWLSSPRAPAPIGAGADGLNSQMDRVAAIRGDGDTEAGEEETASVPPLSLEVAGVEVANAEDSDAVHVEYVLRATYREVWPAQDSSRRVPSEGGVTVEEINASASQDDPKTEELATLAAASRGLVHRSRVVTKRLNSLCALHPRLMWEVEEGKRLLLPGCADAKPPAFPDPYELGTLEEDVLRNNREKLTLRFKGNSSMRKLSARISSYLASLLYFLGMLERVGHAELRARLSRELNDALSTCDRAGRKRRRGDLILGVRLADDPDGKLGSWIDDEARLRLQRRRCMGCGRAIAAEFLGIKKDYLPCRLVNGLFCRSQCHNEGRRVIPHRIVHHWDFTPHRVSKASAAFLDAIRFLPMIPLQAEAPRSVLDNQTLRMVRSRRTQLHLVRGVILFPPERKCTTGELLLEKLLHGRLHLAIDPGLYSIDDLVGAKKGTLTDFLEETLEILLAHVMDDCEACEARAARVCSACHSGDPVFVFQTGLVARCSNCESLFHTKCLMKTRNHTRSGSIGTSKWWIDLTEGNKNFVCPQCFKTSQIPAAFGE